MGLCLLQPVGIARQKCAPIDNNHHVAGKDMCVGVLVVGYEEE
jgi:hypothetical protein